jgi:glycosyltransferase involved in cell wall biosynthesis
MVPLPQLKYRHKVPRSRCDLHLHSTASAANDEWYSREFGCPESFAEPVEQYALCKARGMSLVTLTDHDTIVGGLQLVDRPDFFLSEEVSAEFPEDGCQIHILAWNITIAQHEKLQAARPSVYAVVEVLRRENITHACAHPLFSPNWKLTVEALERIVTLFPILEGTNGLTDRRLEGDLVALLKGLDSPARAAIAQRHGLVAAATSTILVSGSDSHTSRQCASCFTSVAGDVVDPREYLDHVASGRAERHGESASLDVMSMTVGRVTYGFLNARKIETPAYRDPFLDLVDVIGGRERGTDQPTGIRDELVRSFLIGAARSKVPIGTNLGLDGDATASELADAIRRSHDGLIGYAFEELVAGIGDLDMYRVLGAMRDGAAAAVTMVPFLFAANHFARQRGHAQQVLSAWHASPRPPARTCLAIFSDTIDHVDGVTSSVRRFARRARADGRSVKIPYCGTTPPHDPIDGTVYVPLSRASSHSTSLYEGIELHLPSPLDTIDWLWRNDITHVELATPGPMGVVGLLGARLLKLPVTASYHTEVPELLRHLSTNPMLHRGARVLAAWFYGSVDRVFTFSDMSRRRLIDLGVNASKIEHVPVAIDPHEFSPVHICADVLNSLGVRARRERIVLTVGRLSREKNLPMIVDAITRLQDRAHPPVLVIVGEGPERESLAYLCKDKPYIVFVGLQQGDMLKRLFATANAFVFASRIDTLGLSTMEAMTSGTPVLVPSDAAIAEFVVHGSSGYCYEFGVDGLVQTLGEVLDSPTRHAEIATNGRQAMVERWDQAQFADVWRTMAGGD